MSEWSKYQLLLQTDYVRLKEKYDHLYIYSHILSSEKKNKYTSNINSVRLENIRIIHL
jgi:hypothetical protein